MSYLRCASCDVPLFDDPHWPDPALDAVCDACCGCLLSERSLLDASEALGVDAPAPSARPAGGSSPATPGAPADEAVSPPVGRRSRSPEVGTTQPSPRAVQDGQMPGRGRADTTNEETPAAVHTSAGA